MFCCIHQANQADLVLKSLFSKQVLVQLKVQVISEESHNQRLEEPLLNSNHSRLSFHVDQFGFTGLLMSLGSLIQTA